MIGFAQSASPPEEDAASTISEAEAAAIADVEKAIREHFDAKRYAELEAYCSGVLVETPYDSAAIRAKDAIVRSYILTGQDAQAAAATAELLNQFGSVPGASRALCNIGDAWRNEGKIAEAQQVYRETLVRYPGDEFARWSQLHLCMMALERNDVQETVDSVWRMIGDFDEDPGMPLAAVQIGEALFAAEHREPALQIYDYLLANHADNEATVWAQKNICTMLINAGDDAGAAAAVQTLITKFEDAATTPAALVEIGDRYRDAKKLADALQVYQHAAAVDPANLDARRALSLIHLKLADTDSAANAAWGMIADLAKDSGMPLAAVQVAEELAKTRQPDMALEIYRYLVDNHADNEATVWAQKNICTMLIDAGDAAGAAAAMETLVTRFESAPTTPDSLKQIGDKYRDAGKCDNALQAYQYAAAADPGSLDTQKALCLTSLKLRDTEAAADAAWRMIVDFADHEWMPLAAVQMGEEFAKAGRSEIAMDIYQYMVENHADRKEAAWAQKNICIMLIEAGDEPAAAAAIETLATQFKAASTTPESLLAVGDKYCDLKQFDRALEIYTHAAAGESNALYAQKAKCLALLQMKDITAAADAAWRMILDYPDDERMPLAAVQLADAFLAQQPDTALEIYQYAVNGYPDTDAAVWAQKNICDMLIDADDETGAAMAIDKLKTHFESKETVAAALMQVADKYRGLNQLEPAREICTAVVAEYADTPSALWGSQRLIVMDIDETEDPNAPLDSIPPPILTAVEDLINEHAKHSELSEALFLLGEEYYALGKTARKKGAATWTYNYKKCIALWDKVVKELPPGRYGIMARDYRAGAYRAMGDYGAALDGYEYLAREYCCYERHWHACFMVIRCYEEMAAAGLLTSKETCAGIIPAIHRLTAAYPEWAIERLKTDRMIMRWEFMASLEEGGQ